MGVELSNVIFAFSLTLFAGLSTGIGGALILFSKKTNPKFLSVALGFSAGVMIYISFADMLVEANELLAIGLGPTTGAWAATAAFFVGILFIAVIDKLVPEDENPHELHIVEEMDGKGEKHNSQLMRTGLFTALALAIHNFPEGMATFMAALSNPVRGVSVTIAVALHNIPEGIAVALPVFYATRNRKKAFGLSLLSGLAEPLGALVSFLILYRFLNDTLLGLVFAFVAGIMVYISLDELLPAAKEYGEHHLSIYGLVAGMAVMALSVLLLM